LQSKRFDSPFDHQATAPGFAFTYSVANSKSRPQFKPIAT
jgi:hypothetical protein